MAPVPLLQTQVRDVLPFAVRQGVLVSLRDALVPEDARDTLPSMRPWLPSSTTGDVLAHSAAVHDDSDDNDFKYDSLPWHATGNQHSHETQFQPRVAFAGAPHRSSSDVVGDVHSQHVGTAPHWPRDHVEKSSWPPASPPVRHGDGAAPSPTASVVHSDAGTGGATPGMRSTGGGYGVTTTSLGPGRGLHGSGSGSDGAAVDVDPWLADAARQLHAKQQELLREYHQHVLQHQHQRRHAARGVDGTAVRGVDVAAAVAADAVHASTRPVVPLAWAATSSRSPSPHARPQLSSYPSSPVWASQRPLSPSPRRVSANSNVASPGAARAVRPDRPNGGGDHHTDRAVADRSRSPSARAKRVLASVTPPNPRGVKPLSPWTRVPDAAATPSPSSSVSGSLSRTARALSPGRVMTSPTTTPGHAEGTAGMMATFITSATIPTFSKLSRLVGAGRQEVWAHQVSFRQSDLGPWRYEGDVQARAASPSAVAVPAST